MLCSEHGMIDVRIVVGFCGGIAVDSGEDGDDWDVGINGCACNC